MGTEIKPQLLLVDDEPALLMSYRLILEQHGYDVATANNSVCARAMLSERQYDLLLCDLGLEFPLAGMEVVEWARLQCPATRSLLMTGFLDEEMACRAKQAGAETITKPVEVPRLLQIIGHILKDGTAA
jgi:DNA-binding NtrC family response regulator